MATITLRQEGGGHIFQERKINVEDREVLVGRSSEKKKPHTGNAIFSSLGIAREQAVLRYDNYTKRFYLRNIDASTGCTVNGEVAGFYDVEIMNADRVEFGGMSGIESVRAIVMLELGQEAEKDTKRLEQVEPDIKSGSLLWLQQEAEWKFLMRREDRRRAQKEQQKKEKEMRDNEKQLA